MHQIERGADRLRAQSTTEKRTDFLHCLRQPQGVVVGALSDNLSEKWDRVLLAVSTSLLAIAFQGCGRSEQLAAAPSSSLIASDSFTFCKDVAPVVYETVLAVIAISCANLPMKPWLLVNAFLRKIRMTCRRCCEWASCLCVWDSRPKPSICYPAPFAGKLRPPIRSTIWGFAICGSSSLIRQNRCCARRSTWTRGLLCLASISGWSCLVSKNSRRQQSNTVAASNLNRIRSMPKSVWQVSGKSG